MSMKKLFAPFKGVIVAGPRSAMKLPSALLALTLGASALWVGPTAAAEKKYVTDPSTGKVVSAPEYGGTITFARKEEAAGPDVVVSGGWAAGYVSVVNEKLAIADWATPRDKWDFTVPYLPLPFLNRVAGGKLVAARPTDLYRQSPSGGSLA